MRMQETTQIAGESGAEPAAAPLLPIRWPRRRRGWIVGGAVTVALLFCGATQVYLLAPRVIPSSGGIYFARAVALDVPSFRQGDPRWHDDALGKTNYTMGESGCAVTSAAMVLKSYGIDTDPKRLNDYLSGHGGYVGDGYLVWERAADLGKGTIQKAYEDLPSYWRIDWQLIEGNPVIVRIHFPNGRTHFVVIAGKRGFDYLIRDPGAGWDRGLYPLREIVPRIDALRYYRKSGEGG
jgi:hypothetical protein